MRMDTTRTATTAQLDTLRALIHQKNLSHITYGPTSDRVFNTNDAVLYGGTVTAADAEFTITHLTTLPNR